MHTNSSSVPRPTWTTQILFLLLFGIVTLLMQFLTGVYDSELSHYPDESAHIVTSLMVRDYIAAGHLAPPLAFAEEYYVHYPKIGLGMWPPVYYCLTASWLLMNGVSSYSFLFWMATQGAVLCFLAYWLAARFFSTRVAFSIGLLLAANPLMIYSTSLIMVDLMISIFILLAGFFLWRYFENERRSDAIFFALATATAMLTKANGNALVLAPFLMLPLTRKFHLLKRIDLYLAGILVVLLGLPWQIYSFRLLQNTAPVANVSASHSLLTAGLYTNDLIRNLGWSLLIPALIAIAWEVRVLFMPLEQRGPHAILRATLLAVAVSVFVFHCAVPTPPDQRYILSLFPIFLVFAGLGIERIIRAPLDSWRGASVCAAVVVLFSQFAFAIPVRAHLGFNTIARSVPRDTQVVLVCSDSMGEGGLISSIALQENRLGHIVLRGSKSLSTNAWFLTTYKPLFSSTAALQEFLFQNVDSIIVDLSEVLWEQDRQAVLKCIRENPNAWHLAARVRETRTVELYDRVGPPLPLNRKLRIPMGITLNRDLESTTGSMNRKSGGTP